MASDDVSRIELLLREHFARTDKQISDMRADNAEFRAEMVRLHNEFAEKQNAKFDSFTQKIDAKFEAFTQKIDTKINTFTQNTDTKFDSFTQKIDSKFEAFTKEIKKDIGDLKTEVVALRVDVTGLQHDVAGLYHWNYWTLSIIIALVAMPQIMAGIKALIGGVMDAISAVARIFRKDSKA